MARAVHVASGTAGAQAVTGSGSLVGYSATAGAAAGFVLRDGTTSAGSPLAFETFAAAGTVVRLLPAAEFATGVFVDRATAATELVLYVED